MLVSELQIETIAQVGIPTLINTHTFTMSVILGICPRMVKDGLAALKTTSSGGAGYGKNLMSLFYLKLAIRFKDVVDCIINKLTRR